MHIRETLYGRQPLLTTTHAHSTYPLVLHSILGFTHYSFYFFYWHNLKKRAKIHAWVRPAGRQLQTARTLPRPRQKRAPLTRSHVPGAFCSDIHCLFSGPRWPSFQSGWIQYPGPETERRRGNITGCHIPVVSQIQTAKIRRETASRNQSRALSLVNRGWNYTSSKKHAHKKP